MFCSLNLSGQVLIDTNTIKQANTYLVKGAIAREQVTHLRKIVTADSIIIAEQDSVIVKVRINNAHLREKNKALVSENKAISRTLSVFKSISIGQFLINDFLDVLFQSDESGCELLPNGHSWII